MPNSQFKVSVVAVHNVQPGSPNQCEIQPRCCSELGGEFGGGGPPGLAPAPSDLAEAELAVFAEMFCHQSGRAGQETGDLLQLLLPPSAATTTDLSADRKVMEVEVLSKLKDNKKKDKLCQSVNPSDKSSQDLLKTKIFSFKNILLFISMVLSHNSYRHRRGRREYFLHHQ